MTATDPAPATPGRIPPIRVLVVDDHPVVRMGIVGLIRAENGLELVGEADSGEAALDLVPRCRPDVILMDLLMPDMDGIETLKLLRQRTPGARVVMLTGLLDGDEVRRALNAGASGYVLKNASAQELVNVVRAAHAGQRVMAGAATEALNDPSRRDAPGQDLTRRERELLALMARGLNNRDIAVAMDIALPTVKFHVTNILAKLHADNRTEAVLTAIRHRLVPPQ